MPIHSLDPWSRGQYTELHNKISQVLDDANEEEPTRHAFHPKRYTASIFIRISLLFFICTTLILSVYLFTLRSSLGRKEYTTIWCTHRIEYPNESNSSSRINLAPADEAIEYKEEDFVNHFDHQTIYRGPPTHEREKAWRALWQCKKPYEYMQNTPSS
jgi:hypothetical protein